MWLYLVVALTTVLLVKGNRKDLDANDIPEMVNRCKNIPTCNGNLTDETASNIEMAQASFSIAESFLEVFEEVASKRKGKKQFKKQMKRMMGRLSGALGAIGPIGDLVGALYPSAEEQLLKQVQTQIKVEFEQINDRMDEVFIEMNNLGALIEDQAMKTAYQDEKDAIKNNYALMTNFFTAPSNSAAGYKQRVKARTEVEDAPLNLLRALVNGDYFHVFLNKEKHNRKKVHQRMYHTFNLVMNGAKFYLFWLRVMSEDDPAYGKAFQATERAKWVRKLTRALKKMADFDDRNFVRTWDTHYDDFTNQIRMGGSNKMQAARVHAYMSGKYDWVDWVLIIHDEVSMFGTDYKRWVNVNNSTRVKSEDDWDEAEDKNVILAWVDVETDGINKNKARDKLKTAKTWKKVYQSVRVGSMMKSIETTVALEDAEETAKSIMGIGDFAGLVVIRDGYNLVIEGPLNRYYRHNSYDDNIILLQ